MNDEIKFEIGAVAIVILLIAFIVIFFATAQHGIATITSGQSYEGEGSNGKSQVPYFNATITFRDHTTTHLFTCNYYHVGDSINVTYNIGVWQFPDTPQGC